MTHFARTQSDATWTNGGLGGYVTLYSDWKDLDRKVFQSVNGDRGGCWAPSAPIVVTGAVGVSILRVNGPSVINYGGTLTLSAGAAVRLADGDWPRFGASHALRKRTIVTSCLERQTTPDYHWLNAIASGGVQSIACSVQYPSYLTSIFTLITAPSQLARPALILPLNVHDGSRLVSATLSFRVTGPRKAAPVIPPRIRILRMDASGNLTALKSRASGADADGYVNIASPSSASAWYASGGVQYFSYVCDQHNVIDTSQYAYFAQILEEVGALSPIPASTCDGLLVRERKFDVTVATTANVASLSGAQTVDGISVGNASPVLPIEDRVLIKNQTNSNNNGIWIANSGAWVRAPDLATPVDFTPGFLVKVTQGTKNAGLIFECKDPVNTQQITLASAGGTPIHFQRRTARGNVYIAVAANFDSIADMRWQ